jgi:hypothetical protein
VSTYGIWHTNQRSSIFRRTAATLAVNNKAEGCQMQTHFGWKSQGMAQEYIENSRPQRKRMAEVISGYDPVDKSKYLYCLFEFSRLNNQPTSNYL